MRSNVYRDGKVHVAARLCDTCIFRPGNLMHLEPGRVEDMVAGCGENGHIPCHKTLDGDRHVCRGFFDRHRNQVLQVAERLGVVTFAANQPKEANEDHPTS